MEREDQRERKKNRKTKKKECVNVKKNREKKERKRERERERENVCVWDKKSRRETHVSQTVPPPPTLSYPSSPPAGFQVDVDKGFKRCDEMESWICQKKNHFQVREEDVKKGEEIRRK